MRRKKVKKNIKEELEKKRTLKESIKEGSWTSLMNGFGVSYITPFALVLKANNFQIGLLSSFVGLVSPFSQLYGTKIMEKYSRKEIVVKFVLLQALMWIPIISLIFFFWKDIGRAYLPWALIFFYLILAIVGSIASPAWFSWMGDLIPPNKRGSYFSLRGKIVQSVALISMLLASFMLDYFKTKGWVLIGFAILFTIAMIGRLFSANLFRTHYEPKYERELDKKYAFSFWQFIRQGLKTNFGMFVIFIAALHIAVMIASPFFAVYILQEMGLGYTWFIVIMMSTMVYSLIFIRVLGKISDKYGNKFLLKIGAVMLSLHPILWLVSKNVYYLIFVPQLLSGIGWAGFSLASGNFIYDSVKPYHRGLCIAYYNILTGIGMFIGALIGGFLMQNISFSNFDTFFFVFLVSGILRFSSILIFIPRIKEVRHLKEEPHFHISMLNPSQEIIHDLVWIKRKVGKAQKRLKQNINTEFVNWLIYVPKKKIG